MGGNAFCALLVDCDGLARAGIDCPSLGLAPKPNPVTPLASRLAGERWLGRLTFAVTGLLKGAEGVVDGDSPTEQSVQRFQHPRPEIGKTDLLDGVSFRVALPRQEKEGENPPKSTQMNVATP